LILENKPTKQSIETISQGFIVGSVIELKPFHFLASNFPRIFITLVIGLKPLHFLISRCPRIFLTSIIEPRPP
jgi:hypothetical protein